jgi:hypothetical protein
MWTEAENILAKLNAAIAKAATAAGTHIVNINFSGHDFCRTLTGGTVADTWVYGPTLHGFVQGGTESRNIDLDLPGVCPSPHPGDSHEYNFAANGKWDHISWSYDFTATVNCLPHPTSDGQTAIAEAFVAAITSP